MSTVVARDRAPDVARAPLPSRPLRVALLGLGQIGAAVAELALRGDAIRIDGALVRTPGRARSATVRDVPLTRTAEVLFADRPDVLVEVLGGLEPARTLVCDALLRGIPVVTANKSLVARHGDELIDLAARLGVPFLYEASVLAGVPFLGTFAGRAHAEVTAVTGIVNGTSNFILSRMTTDRTDCAIALAEAQRLGFAEPDPQNDVLGIDAAEKLAVLVRHFRLGNVLPATLETTAITPLTAADLAHAASFGGVIKPVVHAERVNGSLRAFAGPAFVSSSHRLAHVDGVENAVLLRRGCGDLFFAGPGAGPAATAATILDDVVRAGRGEVWPSHTGPGAAATAAATDAPVTAWLVRASGCGATSGEDIADLLGSHGVWLRRISALDTRDGAGSRYVLTFPCAKGRIDRALASLRAATGAATLALRTLED